MQTLFENVLTASLYGSIIIVAVLLLRPLLKKVPKKYLCLLWLLAFLRLLMPFEIQFDWSLQPDMTALTQPQAVIQPAIPELPEPVPAVPENAPMPEDVEVVYSDAFTPPESIPAGLESYDPPAEEVTEPVVTDWNKIGEEEDFIWWVDIHDTTQAEIDAAIRFYTEDPYMRSFSWEEAQAKYTDEEFNIREDSFANNGGSPIAGATDAAKLALREYPDLGDHLSVEVFRNEAAGMWKVTIQSYIDYQATYAFRDVYLTDDGETKLLVYEGPVRCNQKRK